MRYSYCWDSTMSNGTKRKLPRGFFRFMNLSDTLLHTCKEGETLWTLASRYYANNFVFPALMYWVIGDFQPEPILDPTTAFTAGQVVYVPSIKTINLYILSPTREPEFETW